MKLFFIAFALGFVFLIGGIFWLLFGEDFVNPEQLYRRFGLEMPANATQVSVGDEDGDAIFIVFRLPRQDARNYAAHPLPGYTAWRAPGEHEYPSYVSGMMPPDFRHLTIAEKWQGRQLWRIMVNETTGDCFAYYNVDGQPLIHR